MEHVEVYKQSFPHQPVFLAILPSIVFNSLMLKSMPRRHIVSGVVGQVPWNQSISGSLWTCHCKTACFYWPEAFTTAYILPSASQVPEHPAWHWLFSRGLLNVKTSGFPSREILQTHFDSSTAEEILDLRRKILQGEGKIWRSTVQTHWTVFRVELSVRNKDLLKNGPCRYSVPRCNYRIRCQWGIVLLIFS